MPTSPLLEHVLLLCWSSGSSSLLGPSMLTPISSQGPPPFPLIWVLEGPSCLRCSAYIWTSIVGWVKGFFHKAPRPSANVGCVWPFVPESVNISWRQEFPRTFWDGAWCQVPQRWRFGYLSDLIRKICQEKTGKGVERWDKQGRESRQIPGKGNCSPIAQSGWIWNVQEPHRCSDQRQGAWQTSSCTHQS